MEVVDIDLDAIPVDDMTFSSTVDEKPSVSFGSGIELLMNDKKKASSSSTKIDLDELDNLEAELNDLSSGTSNIGGGVLDTHTTKTDNFSANLHLLQGDLNISVSYSLFFVQIWKFFMQLSKSYRTLMKIN